MERLTFEGNFCDISQCIGEHRMTSMCEDGDCDARKVWYRLKEYEDTGLKPKDCGAFRAFMNEAISKGVSFNRIVELMEAEEHGRLFIAPVKVGDMLWPVYWDEVLGAWSVDDVPERVNEVGSEGFFLAACLGDPEAPDEFHPYEEIGKEFFLTREKAVEAAAAKVKEVQGDGRSKDA